ncbi:hypothetical protein GPECTOR_14g278 [Gonium pectorale]|uniref:Alpha-glucan water dikinase-like N-terminal Ig-like domain-containing protein n=1 Tax=Gonium pectorale TaxID=33097 RepID=A0A150GMF9_GONPE|nr:hypothetical protein GPECTOR_14g278 [Gonium pectorale]|eukprot:KXZ51039.1 hypothetical protein GPECTOR_14g278 [Gonium pectorale]
MYKARPINNSAGRYDRDGSRSGGLHGRGAWRPAPWVCAAAATLAPTTEERGPVDTSLSRYRCHSKDGAVVDAVVDSADERSITVRVTASYDNVPQRRPEKLMLHWGMYRASGTKWHHPKEAVPPESTPEQGGSGAMRTAMAWDAQGGPTGRGAWTVRFSVPAQLAPLHLAFALYTPGRERYDTPRRAAHFSVPVGMGAGCPQPLGASVVAARPGPAAPADPRDVSAAVNFAVFSRHASSMQLCLVRVKPAEGGGHPAAPLVAQNVLEDLSSLCWAWRADGEILWQSGWDGNRFHPGFMLMDPHATRALPVLLPPSAHKAAPRLAPQQRADEPVWLGGLAAFVAPPFDWQGQQSAGRGGPSRVRSAEEAVVVELDVASFTTGPEAEALVPPEHRGKYLGILDRVDVLKAVGATAVMLTPVTLTADPRDGRRSPLSLMAPDPAFAVGGPLAAADELKTAIRGLHRAGLEVILQAGTLGVVLPQAEQGSYTMGPCGAVLLDAVPLGGAAPAAAPAAAVAAAPRAAAPPAPSPAPAAARAPSTPRTAAALPPGYGMSPAAAAAAAAGKKQPPTTPYKVTGGGSTWAGDKAAGPPPGN